MTIVQRYNTFACLTVFLGILCFSVAEEHPLLALLAAPVTLAGWVVGRAGDNQTPWALPRGTVNILVLVAVLNAGAKVFVFKRHEAIVSDLAEFLVYVQLIKLFDRRRPRDDGQLLSLSLFIVIGAILTNNSLGVGAALLLYTPLATYSTMLLQVRNGQLLVAESHDRQSLHRPRMVTGRRHTRHFRRLAAATIGATLAISIVVFLIMPRGFGSNAFGSLGAPLAGAGTGFTDRIRVGFEGVISESQRPVMDVEVIEGGRNVGSNALTVYLRGTVQDEYDPISGRWNRAADATGQEDRHTQAGGVPMLFESGRDGSLLTELRVQMRNAGMEGYFFTRWRPVSIRPAHTIDIATTPLDATDDRVAKYRGHRRRHLNYVVQSDRDFRFNEEPTPTEGDSIRRFSRLDQMEGSALQDLAIDLLQERDLPLSNQDRGSLENRAVVATFQDYLRQTCSYSLDLQAPPPGRDPVEWFALEKREGHCEYFASALTLMCWSVGIDARVIAGYVATEFNDSTGKYVVREANAHAWVEAQLSPGHWTTFDPTPPGDLNRIHRAKPGLLGRLRRYYEQLEFGWATAVVGFDARTRARFFGSSPRDSVDTNWTNRIGSAVTEWTSLVVDGTPLPKTLWGRMLMGVIVSTILVAAAIVLRQLGRQLLTVMGRPHPGDKHRRRFAGAEYYEEALRLLDRAGLSKPAHLPPATHAARLRNADAPVGDSFASIADLYYQQRFGEPHRAPDRPASSAATLLERLDESLKRYRATAPARR